jgi:predicted small secreted protein
MQCMTKLIVSIILAAATFLFTGCDNDEYGNGYDIALLPPSGSEAEAALDSTFDPKKNKDRQMDVCFGGLS